MTDIFCHNYSMQNKPVCCTQENRDVREIVLSLLRLAWWCHGYGTSNFIFVALAYDDKKPVLYEGRWPVVSPHLIFPLCVLAMVESVRGTQGQKSWHQLLPSHEFQPPTYGLQKMNTHMPRFWHCYYIVTNYFDYYNYWLLIIALNNYRLLQLPIIAVTSCWLQLPISI